MLRLPNLVAISKKYFILSFEIFCFQPCPGNNAFSKDDITAAHCVIAFLNGLSCPEKPTTINWCSSLKSKIQIIEALVTLSKIKKHSVFQQ